MRGPKERQPTELLAENSTQESELDSLPIKINSGMEEVKGVFVPTEILDSVSESISVEDAHETATESDQQAINEKTEVLNSKSNAIRYSGDRTSNIFAGICVGIVMGFIVYAVIASGSIKFNPKTPTLTIVLIVGVSILIIALILFGIIRAVIR